MQTTDEVALPNEVMPFQAAVNRQVVESLISDVGNLDDLPRERYGSALYRNPIGLIPSRHRN